MFKHRLAIRSTVAVAVFSGWASLATAQAGLLGGGGALGGGINGALGPRSLDVAGRAQGQVRGEGAAVIRGDRVRDLVSTGAGQAAEAKASLVDKIGHGKTALLAEGTAAQRAAVDKAAQTEAGVVEPAGDSTAAAAGAARSGANASAMSQSTAVPGPTSGATTVPGPTRSLTADAAGRGSTRRAEASAAGSAKASRSGRSASADAAAEARVSR